MNRTHIHGIVHLKSGAGDGDLHPADLVEIDRILAETGGHRAGGIIPGSRAMFVEATSAAFAEIANLITVAKVTVGADDDQAEHAGALA
jgi:hypothetical protein